MIETTNIIKCYEVDGNEVALVGDIPTIQLNSHWNRPELAVICIGQKSYTVVARDLQAALANATNTARF